MSSLPVVSVRIRDPLFGPRLYVRFGTWTSLIVKPTRHETFSERNGFRGVRRLCGLSWRWQRIVPDPRSPGRRPGAGATEGGT